MKNKYYQWGEVWEGVWGTVYLKDNGEINCHNTYNERKWKIETLDSRDYIILIGDSNETAYIEISDNDIMYGRNYEGKVVFLRRFGGSLFKNTIKKAFECKDLSQTIKNLGIISHNHVIPSSLLESDNIEYFIGLQQNPIEYSEYLKFLADKNINTYLEIGTYCGGTFIATMEYLKAIGQTPYGIACDNYIRENLYAYYNDFGNCEIHNVNSASISFDFLIDKQNFDICFIDGDHSYEGVKNDWEKLKNKSRFVVFHDICVCNGVIKLWNEIIQEGYKVETFIFNDKPLGIGVVSL